MSLFQKTVLKKHLLEVNTPELKAVYKSFSAYFHDATRQQNIRNSKEEQVQKGFLRELFGHIFGYTLNPEPNFNLKTELKNTRNSKKVDGAIVFDGNVHTIYFPEEMTKTDSSFQKKRMGMNRVLASDLRIYLDSGEVKGITCFDKPDGVFFPLDKVKQEEKFINSFSLSPALKPKSAFDIIN